VKRGARTLPAAPAWFLHGARRAPHAGVVLPQRQGLRFFDLGPADVASLLRDVPQAELRARAAAGRPIDEPPVLLPPLLHPSKILCLGKNFVAHAEELGGAVPEEPMFFAKLADTLVGHGAAVVLPHWVTTRIDHEVELGVVLGFDDSQQRGARDVPAERALELVAGYTVLNDVTARRLQGDDREQKKPWLRSKSFDTFCPLGPWVVPRSLLPDVHRARISLTVNDATRQDSRLDRMVVGIADAIAFLSRHTRLRPGDLIAMGTPEGVGPLQAGDRIVATIEGIGDLFNPVEREAAPA
jgi:2-keto-4-pentenoate hydratase/2-oxohepta-3-ene-1,7-dioic acid hydratase in catechol pathway